MSLVLMFIALCTGITVWWLLIQRLQAKPWTEQGIIDQAVTSQPAPRVGLRVFFGTITSIFAVFVAAYLMRMIGHGGGAHDWTSVAIPGLLWVNTLVLIAGSVALQRARNAIDRGQQAGVLAGMVAGGLATVVFLLGQYWAWQQLTTAGHPLTSGPAAAFFYILTGVHGLHLIGGLLVWATTTIRLWRGLARHDATTLGRLQLNVQLCTVYWHFLLAVWLVLFVLLLVT